MNDYIFKGWSKLFFIPGGTFVNYFYFEALVKEEIVCEVTGAKSYRW